MTDPHPQPRLSPFVGPRSFRYGEKLYGRDHEIMDLADLLIAERIMLLYSPSGAGKTSLVQSGLRKRLEEEDFQVPPTARISLEPPVARDERTTSNRYLLSTLWSFEEGRTAQLAERELAGMGLADYLDQQWPQDEGSGGLILIFDQFEELLTADPTDIEAKRAFLSQLGVALEDRRRWALFVMREEHVGGLDPYRRLIPTRLHKTYRLDLLKERPAFDAIQLPCRDMGVEFTDAAARRLVDDLRRVQVQRPDGTVEEQLGPDVEPVQLQVVCERLWNRLIPGAQEIGEDDVLSFGDVGKALAAFYSTTVSAVATETGVPELVIRRWVEEQLTTAHGLRNQVMQEDPKTTRGLDSRVIDALVKAHLLRAERRRGVTWFELSHDRLVDPIRRDNASWRQINLSLLQQKAALWDEKGRPGELRLSGEALREAKHWASRNKAEMGPVEREFLTASLDLQDRARLRRGLYLLVSVLLISSFFIFYQLYASWAARQPWGFMRDMASGKTYEMTREVVILGRRTEQVKPDVNVSNRYVSRVHLLVSKDGFIAVDMRSRNGTTVNAEFLPYGSSAGLNSGDLVTLAGAAAFLFAESDRPILRLLFGDQQTNDPAPPNAWGMVIDGSARSAKFLTLNRSFVSVRNGILEIDETEQEGAVLEIDISDGGELFVRRPAESRYLDIIEKYRDLDGYNYHPIYLQDNQSLRLWRPSPTGPGTLDILSVTFCAGTYDFEFHSGKCDGIPFVIIPVVR